MNAKCALHQKELHYYCLICKKGYCTNCYLERKNCQNKNHHDSIIDYEIFLYGCCEKHFKKFIGGCIKCNRAWCMSCITEGNECHQKAHEPYISNYLQYKAFFDKNVEKKEVIQEKPSQEHVFRIQKILKIIKDNIIQNDKNEEKLNLNFKIQVLQIFHELNSYNLKNRQNISIILSKIFKSSLILKSTQQAKLRSKIKSKVIIIRKINNMKHYLILSLNLKKFITF